MTMSADALGATDLRCTLALRRTLAALLLLGCASAAPGRPTANPPPHAPNPNGANDTLHLTGPTWTGHGATTDAVILGRLLKTAAEIPPTASVPRIALADLAYPASQDELRRLGGFAVLLVTVLCHDAQELPVDRVEVRIGPRVAPLTPVTSRRSELARGGLSDVFGRFRYDGVFLLPVFSTRATATVTVYLGGGAFPLKVLQFPEPPGDDSFPAGLDFDWDPYAPEVEALRALLDRELPVIGGGGLADQ
jgi:hypothetical protein